MAESKKRAYFRKEVNGYKFIQLDAEIIESPAYRNLTPIARALLLEFTVIFRPRRNGLLSISTANAATRLNVSENTVTKPFYMLMEHGFISLTKGHIWTKKLAREWRLTFHKYNDKEPTDEWKQWQPNKPVCYTPLSKKKPTVKTEVNNLNNSGKPNANSQVEA